MTLLWTSLALEVIKLPLDWPHRRLLASTLSIGIRVGLTAVIMFLLIWKIGQGRNWARIIFLLLFAVGCTPFLVVVYFEFVRSFLLGLISIIQIAMQFFALLLIFTYPGRTFFGQSQNLHRHSS